MNAVVTKCSLYFIVLFALAGWCSCNSEVNLINKLDQLQGTWEMQIGETKVCEKWKLENDTLLSGVSYEIINNDSAITERIQISFSNGQLFYIPTVANQNDGKPISFVLTQNTDSLFVFENPEHDFPTRISYAFLSENELLATISGEIRGETRSLEFSYLRSK